MDLAASYDQCTIRNMTITTITTTMAAITITITMVAILIWRVFVATIAAVPGGRGTVVTDFILVWEKNSLSGNKLACLAHVNQASPFGSPL